MYRLNCSLSPLIRRMSGNAQKHRLLVSLFAVLVLVLSAAACDETSPSAPPPQSQSVPPAGPISAPPAQPTLAPTAISVPTPYSNNLIIRIDSVTITKDDGHGGLGGKVYFVVLAVRDYGGSAKLILPGKDTYQAKVGQKIELGKFSLGINNVRYSQNERITIYLLGLDTNKQSPGEEAVTNVAVDGALEVAKRLLEERLPGVSLVASLLQDLSGPALDFWRDEKVLGEYSGSLSQENNWLAGKQYQVTSTNGNLDIRFTVLQNIDVLGNEPTETVSLTVVNNSSVPVEKLYVARHDCPDKNAVECRWGKNLLPKSIQPGDSQNFEVPVGFYDLRAEGTNGSVWEYAALALISNQKWTITNSR